MMHTVMPMELVFPQETTSPALKQISHAGVNLLVEELSSGRHRVERILSSNPMDFLNPQIQPGSTL
jgi:hypothetical protein